MRDFDKAWEAIPSGYSVRYPRLDEPDLSQVDEGSLGIQYASFEAGL